MCGLRNFFVYFLMICLSLKATTGNVIFRFGFDFGLDSEKTTFNTTLQIGDKSPRDHNGGEAKTFTTTAPLLADMWERQAKLNGTANDKLESTRVAVTQMKSDLYDLVGRSDYIATKVKLMTRYLQKANAAFDNTAVNRFTLLQEFVQLVDDLRAPPNVAEGGERSLEYVLMKLALERYKLIELQSQIVLEVLQAYETWQTYVQTQLIDVASV